MQVLFHFYTDIIYFASLTSYLVVRNMNGLKKQALVGLFKLDMFEILRLINQCLFYIFQLVVV